MIWKILLLVAAIVVVLAGFKYLNRPAGGRPAKARTRGKPDRADGQSVDLVKCPNCGAFMSPGTVCGNCRE
jgi:ribosomal protein L32